MSLTNGTKAHLLPSINESTFALLAIALVLHLDPLMGLLREYLWRHPRTRRFASGRHRHARRGRRHPRRRVDSTGSTWRGTHSEVIVYVLIECNNTICDVIVRCIRVDNDMCIQIDIERIRRTRDTYIGCTGRRWSGRVCNDSDGPTSVGK